MKTCPTKRWLRLERGNLKPGQADLRPQALLGPRSGLVGGLTNVYMITSPSTPLMELLRQLIEFAVQVDFTFECTWIFTRNSPLADTASRFQHRTLSPFIMNIYLYSFTVTGGR
jgi:hypothetical protein